jgi:hypothetical protein
MSQARTVSSVNRTPVDYETIAFLQGMLVVEEDTVLISAPQISVNTVTACLKQINEFKRDIGQSRKGIEVLQKRKWVSEGIVALRRLQNGATAKFFQLLTREIKPKVSEEEYEDLMSYNELLQKYPKFYYSGKQFSELKKQSSAILKYFGTDEAKALMPDNQASPNFWMGTLPPYSLEDAMRASQL